MASSAEINGRCFLTCHMGVTSCRQARITYNSGRASRLSSQQRCVMSHSSSTRPSCGAAFGLYGRIPFKIASLILSIFQPSYGICPQSTCCSMRYFEIRVFVVTYLIDDHPESETVGFLRRPWVLGVESLGIKEFGAHPTNASAWGE